MPLPHVPPSHLHQPPGAGDLYRPLLRSALFVAFFFCCGVAGYSIIGGEAHGLVDAIYMTTLTLTTVGYGEIIYASSPNARLFTTFLMLGGVGSWLYFFSRVTAFFVEGSIQMFLWRKRMMKSIEQLTFHTIVCGGGHTGEHIVRELLATDRPFVLIEQSADRVAQLMELVGKEFPTVIGDASEDSTLKAAGIERANCLVTCVSNDKDNLIVTVSARILRPGLRIVSRCIEERVGQKITKAGADAVVSPSRIGGLRLVSEAVRPTAVSFLDQMLRDGDLRLRVESTKIQDGSELANWTVGNVRERKIRDLLLMALQDLDGAWIYNPADDTRLAPGMSIVYMGGPETRQAVEEVANG